MTTCALCGQAVPMAVLTHHWLLNCTRTLQSQVKVARAIARAEEESPLLARVWEQIDEILVDTEFVR